MWKHPSIITPLNIVSLIWFVVGIYECEIQTKLGIKDKMYIIDSLNFKKDSVFNFWMFRLLSINIYYVNKCIFLSNKNKCTYICTMNQNIISLWCEKYVIWFINLNPHLQNIICNFLSISCMTKVRAHYVQFVILKR